MLLDVNLLDNNFMTNLSSNSEVVQKQQILLEDLFKSQKVNVTIVDVSAFSSSIVFDIELLEGTKLKDITKLKSDIEYATGFYAEIGRRKYASNTLTIVLNKDVRPKVSLKDILNRPEFLESNVPMLVAAGRASAGEPLYIDLDDVTNMFVYGTTGAGKSVFLDDIIVSLLFRCTPEELQFLIIDNKGVDFNCYAKLPHMREGVITSSRDAAFSLMRIKEEIARRTSMFSIKGVKSFEQYNELPNLEKLPRLCIIIDEYWDLIRNEKKEYGVDSISESIEFIASHGRLCGVRLVIATQYLVDNVIDSAIQNNFHFHVRFAIYGKEYTNLDAGSEKSRKLLGSGDMLIKRMVGGSADELRNVRAQACYVSPNEIDRVVSAIIKG